ncbi:uncharacterized protein N7458_010669 [Penicillium daleae]|uniref:Uncharacterized protein n=1 Tax=Penicillium daleae TaxID=63821 RepID=A0AAD6C1I1_9EURO|nr:uncharacterized protein N7458_010669 [Penicillium daleae]KAJ5439671.1 hypothetical protein N7458_010669 [Penicillium daleae]
MGFQLDQVGTRSKTRRMRETAGQIMADHNKHLHHLPEFDPITRRIVLQFPASGVGGPETTRCVDPGEKDLGPLPGD